MPHFCSYILYLPDLLQYDNDAMMGIAIYNRSAWQLVSLSLMMRLQ